MDIALIGAELEENLGLRYIASSLEAKDHRVAIIPFNAPQDIDEAVGLTQLDQHAFLHDPASYRKAWVAWQGGTDDPEAQP